jgi:hypothetical protein
LSIVQEGRQKPYREAQSCLTEVFLRLPFGWSVPGDSREQALATGAFYPFKELSAAKTNSARASSFIEISLFCPENRKRYKKVETRNARPS